MGTRYETGNRRLLHTRCGLVAADSRTVSLGLNTLNGTGHAVSAGQLLRF